MVTKADLAVDALQEITAREMLLGAKFSYLYGYFIKTTRTAHANGLITHWEEYFDQQGNPLTDKEAVAIRLKTKKMRDQQWLTT